MTDIGFRRFWQSSAAPCPITDTFTRTIDTGITDTFTRTVATGASLGTADAGNVWSSTTYTRTNQLVSVDGSQAVFHKGGDATLGGLSSLSAIEGIFEFHTASVPGGAFDAVTFRLGTTSGLGVSSAVVLYLAASASAYAVEVDRDLVGSYIQIPFSFTPTSTYRVRVYSDQTVTRVKVWLASDSEPGSWTAELTGYHANFTNMLYVANNIGSADILMYFDNLDITGVPECLTTTAFDDYERTVASGWGTASSGVPWTEYSNIGVISSAVSGSSGTITTPTPGDFHNWSGDIEMLSGVSTLWASPPWMMTGRFYVSFVSADPSGSNDGTGYLSFEIVDSSVSRIVGIYFAMNTGTTSSAYSVIQVSALGTDSIPWDSAWGVGWYRFEWRVNKGVGDDELRIWPDSGTRPSAPTVTAPGDSGSNFSNTSLHIKGHWNGLPQFSSEPDRHLDIDWIDISTMSTSMVSGEIGEGWGCEQLTVTSGKFSTTRPPARGTLTVFDSDGKLMHPWSDYEPDGSSGSDFTTASSTTTVVVCYLAFSDALRAQPSSPKNLSTSLPADRLRLNDIHGK